MHCVCDVLDAIAICEYAEDFMSAKQPRQLKPVIGIAVGAFALVAFLAFTADDPTQLRVAGVLSELDRTQKILQRNVFVADKDQMEISSSVAIEPLPALANLYGRLNVSQTLGMTLGDLPAGIASPLSFPDGAMKAVTVGAGFTEKDCRAFNETVNGKADTPEVITSLTGCLRDPAGAFVPYKLIDAELTRTVRHAAN